MNNIEIDFVKKNVEDFSNIAKNNGDIFLSSIDEGNIPGLVFISSLLFTRSCKESLIACGLEVEEVEKLESFVKSLSIEEKDT